ncbi:hypothetical protein KJ877_10065 [bacterium]|nr:hypothetical protein [bacterium]MBU1991165.1 hypothetical protein [bacterium]
METDKLSDMDKYRIELLRDSYKDAVDTIRAVDKKVSFVLAFKTYFTTALVTTFVHLINEGYLLKSIGAFSYIIVAFMLCIASILYSLWQFQPKVNPTEPFIPHGSDSRYGNNTLFISTNLSWSNKCPTKKHLNTLVMNMGLYTSNIENMKRLMYKEITQVSYIRDWKIKNLSRDIRIITFGVIFFILSGLLGVLWNIS